MIPDKRNILVLTELIKGGELSATLSMVETLLNSYNLRMSLIAFDNHYTEKKSLFENVVIMQHSNQKKPMSFLKNLFFDFNNTRKQIKLLSRKTKIDVVISTNYLMMLAATILLRKMNVKKVFYFHGIKHTPFASFWQMNYRQSLIIFLEKIAIIFSSLVIVPSDISKVYINKFIHPFIKKEIYIVPNLISDIFFNKFTTNEVKNFRKHLGLSTREKIILYCGRIAIYKGLDNLIDSFKLFLNDYKDTKLVLAYPSNGSDKKLINSINKKIYRLNINKHVFQVKDLKISELAKLYTISFVTVLPSELEFAPISILESMAVGTPVISTDVGNAKEIIRCVDPELIMNNNTPSDIYSKLRYIFSLSKVNKKKISDRSVKTALLYGRQKQNINLFI